ncbi:MarR family winged helix-turn-helix transcriptional regulator [Rubinisphaera margarita]|uniref:MarR family winged helix-turn-helix transcriptional regulator n=1 Tax=Rubinisphaera margarita TaxID=2909586 RepID=UPI001EE8E01C|nr:MarR family transcriptional regulator [Rubinisphaera margarita]MCG6156443.1 MarR family transcriptional regulator [Rubinisphaera margarita]
MNPKGLQQELKKRHPFKSREQEAVLGIMRTSDLIQNRFGRLFREYGLTASQYNVLRILRGEGAPLPCLEIASRMIQVVPAITGLIDRLEKHGLVERKRCDKDRRVIYIALTEKAESLLKEMDDPVMDMHRDVLGHLSKSELTEITRLLDKARAGLKEL